MATGGIYPFGEVHAKLFSQELIQWVLKDFGHTWKPQRSPRQQLIFYSSMNMYISEIGKAISFFSRKHAGFVIMTCYNNWKYINSHRNSVMDCMVFNAIIYLCKRCKLENDDLGLFIFVAIVVEYARFAIIDNRRNLVDSIANSLGYCIEVIIPGGFITILERMRYRAYSLTFLHEAITDYSLESASEIEASLEVSVEFESPLNMSWEYPHCNDYGATMEEIVIELKKRENHRQLSAKRIIYSSSTETDFEASCAFSLGSVDSVFEATGSEEGRKPQVLATSSAEQIERNLKDVNVRMESQENEISGNRCRSPSDDRSPSD